MIEEPELLRRYADEKAGAAPLKESLAVVVGDHMISA